MKCPDCGKESHWRLVIPNPLCWMFEFQKPEFMWNSRLGCEILWNLHELTCLDNIRIRLEYRNV